MKKWDEHLLQHRSFQKGNGFANTEDVFRKGKTRYIHCHKDMKPNIHILIWLLDQASMVIMKYNALEVQLYKHWKNLIVYSYFSAILVWLYKVYIILIYIEVKYNIYEPYNRNVFHFCACHLCLYRTSLLQKEPFCEEALLQWTPEEKRPAASKGLTFVLSHLATPLNLERTLLWLTVYDIPSAYEL